MNFIDKKTFGSAIGLLLSLVLVSCGDVQEGRREERTVSVNVMEIALTDSLADDYYVGTVEEYRFSSLAFSVIGTVQSVYKEVGQRVAKGEVLARLDSSSFYEAYRIARVALEQAEDGFRRMKQLHDGGTLPEVQWVDINTKLAQAQATERIAHEKLAATRLKAPFDGVLSMRNCEPGEVAVAAVPVLKVVDLDELCVRIAVPENEISKLDDPRIEILVPALGERFHGEIDSKNISSDRLSHTYGVKIRMLNPEKKLLPGMLAEVYTRKEHRDIVIVPANVVQISHDGTRFVWVVEGGRACRREIRVGKSYVSGVEVVSGLEPGDLVVTRGSHKVSQGMKVKII